MTTTKHPTELTDDEAAGLVDAFDDSYLITDHDALKELRVVAAARRDAESRIEAAALRAHRDGASRGVIGNSSA